MEPHLRTSYAHWPINKARPAKVVLDASISRSEIVGSVLVDERRTEKLLKTLTLLFLLLSSHVVQAHEYWLAPVQSAWQIEQTFQADIRNGEHFAGTPYPFDSEALRVGGIVSDTARRDLTGRLGDYPAIAFELQEPGVQLVLLETTARHLEYDSTADFSEFLVYHALDNAVAQHQTKAIGDKPVSEKYYRFVKTLFHVAGRGSPERIPSFLSALENHRGAPALAAQGQQLEIVVNRADSENGTLELLLLFEGEPLAGRQIELFHKSPSGEPVTRSVRETDMDGQASFSTQSPGDYLLNSVWITPDQLTDVDWITFWASLTFNIPDDT